MKPQDAKEKFCPFFAQADATSIANIARDFTESGHTVEDHEKYAKETRLHNSKCRGPDCMMWVLKAPSGGDCALKTR